MRIFLLILFTLYSSANFIDSDLDGVEDSDDLCPNSKLFELVDQNGCPTEILANNTQPFNYTLTLNYMHNNDKSEDNIYSLNLFFSYKNFDLSLNYLAYTDNSSLNDLEISAYYNLKKSINTTVTIGTYIPTNSSKSNKTDYFAGIELSYEFKKLNYYISYKRYFNNDLDTYNSNSYKFGLGYYINNKLYSSLTYIRSDSIYNPDEIREYLSIFTNYYLNKNLFISANYDISINSKATDSYSLTLGYEF